MADITEKLDIEWLIYGIACAGRYNTYTMIEEEETIQLKQKQGVVSNELDRETV